MREREREREKEKDRQQTKQTLPFHFYLVTPRWTPLLQVASLLIVSHISASYCRSHYLTQSYSMNWACDSQFPWIIHARHSTQVCICTSAMHNAQNAFAWSEETGSKWIEESWRSGTESVGWYTQCLSACLPRVTLVLYHKGEEEIPRRRNICR
jgi:hypothetical protein